MKEFEFKYEKIKEEDLDIKVSIRHNNITNSYSLEKIRICNVHLLILGKKEEILSIKYLKIHMKKNLLKGYYLMSLLYINTN